MFERAKASIAKSHIYATGWPALVIVFFFLWGVGSLIWQITNFVF